MGRQTFVLVQGIVFKSVFQGNPVTHEVLQIKSYHSVIKGDDVAFKDKTFRLGYINHDMQPTQHPILLDSAA